MYLLANQPVTRQEYIDRFNSTTERAVQITVTTSTPETLYYNCKIKNVSNALIGVTHNQKDWIKE